MGEIRIVLVEANHPGNIGGAARAMKTMGIRSLYLVRPARFPDPQADWRAAQAIDVLESATVVDTLDEAISDCVQVIGTSTRNRRIPWPREDAAAVANNIIRHGYHQPVAIVFGREQSGLTNEELQRCQLHLVIPASREYPSLNLAMAVQVVCYELFKVLPEIPSIAGWDRKLATVKEMEGFYAHLEEVLKRIDFLDPRAPRQAMPRLRRLFGRIGVDETEVGMLRGILSHVEKVME